MKLIYVDPNKCDFDDPTNGRVGGRENILPLTQIPSIRTIDIAYLAEAALERVHLWTGTTYLPKGKDSSQVRIDDDAALPENMDSLGRHLDKDKMNDFVRALNLYRQRTYQHRNWNFGWLSQDLSASPRTWFKENVIDDYVASKIVPGRVKEFSVYQNALLLNDIYNDNDGLYDEIRKMQRPILQIVPFDYGKTRTETTEPLTVGTGTIPTSHQSFCKFALEYLYEMDPLGQNPPTEWGYSYWRAGTPEPAAVNPDCGVPVGGSKLKSTNLSMWGIVYISYTMTVDDRTVVGSHQETHKEGEFLVKLDGIYRKNEYSHAVNFMYQLGVSAAPNLVKSIVNDAGGAQLPNVNQIAASKISTDCYYGISLNATLENVFIVGEMSGNTNW